MNPGLLRTGVHSFAGQARSLRSRSGVGSKERSRSDFANKGIPMGDKSRQKSEKQKPAGKSIKEKRADKRAHAAGDNPITVIPTKK